MPPLDIQSVIDFNDNTNTDRSEQKSCPLQLESPTRKVCFCKTVVAHEVDRTIDMAEEEREATWYSIQELRDIKSKVKDQVFKMTSRRGLIGDFRGLEGRTKEGIERRYQARKSSWDAVFQEQDRQYLGGYDDPEFLAEVSREHTAVSQRLAVLKAKQDERAARDKHPYCKRLSELKISNIL